VGWKECLGDGVGSARYVTGCFAMLGLSFEMTGWLRMEGTVDERTEEDFGPVMLWGMGIGTELIRNEHMKGLEFGAWDEG